MALVVVALSAYAYVQEAPLVEERLKSLGSLQERQLELFQSRVDLLFAAATLIIGGAGALLLHFREHQSGSVPQRQLAILALVSAGLSAFCGYLAYDAAIWMLRSEFFNLTTEAVRIPAVGQLLTSALALSFLVLCFLNDAKPGES